MKKKIDPKKDIKEELNELRIQLAETHLHVMQNDWISSKIKGERRQLDSIMDALPVGISIIDQDYKIGFQNRWMRDKFGSKIEELCYKTYMNAEYPCKHCNLINTIKNKSVEEVQICTADKNYYKIVTTPIGRFNDKDSIIEIMDDVTEERTSEEALLKSKQQYEDLVNDLNVGVYQTTINLGGRFIKVNPALLSLLGSDSEEELLKHKVADFYLDPNDRKNVINIVLKQSFVNNKEFQFKTLKGKIFWGSITLRSKKDEEGNVSLTGILEDITKRKNFEAKLQKTTLLDDLTKLYNHRGFILFGNHQLKLAKRYNIGITLFFLDIDGLKWLNDNKGHAKGDAALIRTADALRRTCRGSDIIARIGGDEFVILMTYAGKINTEVFLTRLQYCLKQQSVKLDHDYTLSVSAGMAEYNSNEQSSLKDLLDLADRSMYEQKKAKRHK